MSYKIIPCFFENLGGGHRENQNLAGTIRSLDVHIAWFYNSEG